MLRDATSWVGWRMAGLGIGLSRRALHTIKSNKTLYDLAYSLRNSHEFSDLYEHEKMLADSVRVDCYAEAIRRLIKPGDVVVDLGTGSGVLAMLAARQGAKVYAIDHSDFITLAEANAHRNGIDTITFVHANSRQFHPPEQVDVLLHEQIGDNLFNENMVDNLLDLKRRLLKPGGRILPGRFELYLEPACLHPDYRVPFLEEMRVQGLDFSHLAEIARSYRAPHYGRRSMMDHGDVEYFLGTPSPALTVDLNEIDDASGLPQRIALSREVQRPGQLDGIYQYFAVVFEESLRFDTSPFSRRTHWRNRLFRMPQRSVAVGERIDYELTLSELRLHDSWAVTLAQPVEETQTFTAPRPLHGAV